MVNVAEHEDIYSSLIQLIAAWTASDVQRDLAGSVGVELDATAIRALYLLGLNGGTISAGRLAELCHTSRPTTSKLVSRLASDGLVERDRAGRTVDVRLTESGRLTYSRLVDAGKRVIADSTAGWGPDELEQFRSHLTRFVDAITATP